MSDYAGNWYGPAIEAGIRPIRLIAGTKRCPSGTWEDHVLRTVDEVRAAFTKGFNVGFLLVGKEGVHPNPLGLWVNDIDSQGALDRFGDHPFNLMVSRDHPAKRHLYGRLPDPSLPRSSRLVRNSHDVKLTGIVVGPGSRHKDGGLYTPFQRSRDTGLWQPWDGQPIQWADLPVVDPKPYMPPPRLIELHPSNAQHVRKEWRFVAKEGAEGTPVSPFAMAGGSLEDRIIRGEGYIRNRLRLKIVSRSGKGGRVTLLVIVTHLLRYLRLPASKVVELLVLPVYGETRSWNAQCVDAMTGEPYPWSQEELHTAIEAAQHYVPAFGVFEFQRLERIQQANERLSDFWTLLGGIPPQDPDPSIAMSAEDLYRAFLDLYSLDEGGCSKRRFTVAIQKAYTAGLIRLRNIRGAGRRKLRYYQGISRELLDLALEIRSEEEPDAGEAA